jgi:hypothetical protein
LAKKQAQEAVVCRDSSYGFLANRVYLAMMNETLLTGSGRIYYLDGKGEENGSGDNHI